MLFTKGRRVFGLCALFLSTLAAQTPQQAEQARQGKELLAAGKYPEAAAVYRALVQALPANPGLRANLAIALHLAGQDKEAVTQFEQVLKVQPAAIPALMMGGVSWMRLGQPAKAAPLFERALTLQPADLETRDLLADALLRLGRNEQAAPHLRKLAEAKPIDPQSWYRLGRAHELAAQSAFERMLKQHPESKWTAALAAEAQGQKPAAARPSPKPAPDEALYWRIRRANEAALAAFKQLGTLPPSAELHEVRAEIHRNQGQYKEALAAYEEGIALAPQNPALRRGLAVTLYAAREYARAESALAIEVSQDQQAADLRFMLGDSILNQQRAAEAVSHLVRSLKLDDALLPAHAALARAYLQTGEQAKAVPHLERALPTDTDGALHYQLAGAYRAAGRVAEAKKMLARYQELQAAAAKAP